MECVMADKAWKAYERRLAAMFGGTRRGADFGSIKGGKNDLICPGWSIECKLWSKPRWAAIVEDVKKAENRRDQPSDIPLAIMKRKGDDDKDSIVAMRLETFLDHFGGGPKDISMDEAIRIIHRIADEHRVKKDDDRL